MPTSVRPKLLIVESDNIFRRKLVERLRQESVQIWETSRDDDARRIVKGTNIDVVVIGLGGVPQLGLQLLKEIKVLRPSTEIIVMMPADAHSFPASIEGMKAGAFAELLIPFDLETLVQSVGEAWRHKLERESEGKARGRKDPPPPGGGEGTAKGPFGKASAGKENG